MRCGRSDLSRSEANIGPVPVAAAVAHGPWDFLNARRQLVASGIPIVEAMLARSEDEAVAIARKLAVPVAIKAEAPGLLHKSDIGCVALGCTGDDAVRQA